MIKAKKSLGQNFLVDEEILKKITGIVDIKDKILSDITEYAMGEYNRIYKHQTEGRQKAIEKNVNRGKNQQSQKRQYEHTS